MSESPERRDMADVETGEAVRDRDDKVGDRRDEDEEMNGVEKGRENGKHERSPSLKSRSPSPADARAADSRSRSPVRRARTDSRERARSDSRDRRRRSRSNSREARRGRYSRSRSRDRDVRRRSRSGERYRSRYSPSPRRDRYRGSRYSPAPSYRRRSPPAPYYSRPRRTPPRHGTTLFVAGLNFVTTEREVESKFDKFGPVKEARIVRNPVNGESRGFGFVSMKYEEDVDAAIRALDGAEWQGRRLGVERARNVK